MPGDLNLLGGTGEGDAPVGVIERSGVEAEVKVALAEIIAGVESQ